MDAPILGPSRDDVSGGPMLHALNCRVKARRVPSARSVCIYLLELPGTQARVVVPKDEIHDVCLAMAQLEQTHPKQYARVAVPGCTARSGTHTASCGWVPEGPQVTAFCVCVQPAQLGRGVVAPAVYKYLTPSKPWQQGQQGFHLRMSELGHSEEGQPCMPCARTQVLIVFACIAVAVYAFSLRLPHSPGERRRRPLHMCN